MAYLVYQHKRQNSSEIFYIGISNNSGRPYSRKGRNKIWHSIVNKHGFYTDILLTGLNKADACEIEIALINKYGRLILQSGKLCNLSNGGGGVSGIANPKHNLVGKKFGNLTVVSYGHGGASTKWNCLCSCGGILKVCTSNLRSGNTKSCNNPIHRVGCNQVDLSGQKFGRLTALHTTRRKIGKIMRTEWVCQCSCGQTKVVESGNLKSGHTQSCGCYQLQKITKHGCTERNKSNQRLYTFWQKMIYKCDNSKDKQYKWYGGSGIYVCKDWYNTALFFEWAINNGYDNDKTIRRIDMSQGFSPDNCRVAPIEGNWNSVGSLGKEKALEIKMLSKAGELTRKQIANKFGIAYTTVSAIVNGYNYKKLTL